MLAISVPFQRVRAAFPSGERLAFEPGLAFTRLSSDGESLTILAFQVGALYNFGATRSNTYLRPFAGIEYVDDSFSGGDYAFDLGMGVGSRSRIDDRLALRFELTATGRFGEGGGTDAVLGASIGPPSLPASHQLLPGGNDKGPSSHESSAPSPSRSLP